jgi:hypothetical protein
MNKHDRRLADRAAVQQEVSISAMGNGYFATAEAIRDFNMKLMEMAQHNMMATLKFAQEVATAKGPPEAAAMWSAHARKSFETLTDQSNQLTGLAQKIMTSAAGPLANGFARMLPGNT